MLRCEARDEGRSLDYEAEERNEADGHFSCKPKQGKAFRAICFVARLANALRPFGAARFAHLIPGSPRRGPEEFCISLLKPGARFKGGSRTKDSR